MIGREPGSNSQISMEGQLLSAPLKNSEKTEEDMEMSAEGVIGETDPERIVSHHSSLSNKISVPISIDSFTIKSFEDSNNAPPTEDDLLKTVKNLEKKCKRLKLTARVACESSQAKEIEVLTKLIEVRRIFLEEDQNSLGKSSSLRHPAAADQAFSPEHPDFGPGKASKAKQQVAQNSSEEKIASELNHSNIFEGSSESEEESPYTSSKESNSSILHPVIDFDQQCKELRSLQTLFKNGTYSLRDDKKTVKIFSGDSSEGVDVYSCSKNETIYNYFVLEDVVSNLIIVMVLSSKRLATRFSKLKEGALTEFSHLHPPLEQKNISEVLNPRGLHIKSLYRPVQLSKIFSEKEGQKICKILIPVFGENSNKKDSRRISILELTFIPVHQKASGFQVETYFKACDFKLSSDQTPQVFKLLTRSGEKRENFSYSAELIVSHDFEGSFSWVSAQSTRQKVKINEKTRVVQCFEVDSETLEDEAFDKIQLYLNGEHSFDD